MSKNPPVPKAASQPSASTKAPAAKVAVSPFKKFANPQAIVEQLEAKSTGVAPDDPYRARIEAIMGLLLPRQGDADSVGDAEHIRETTAGLVLETAARPTGFILGFEYSRDLMLSGATGGVE